MIKMLCVVPIPLSAQRSCPTKSRCAHLSPWPSALGGCFASRHLAQVAAHNVGHILQATATAPQGAWKSELTSYLSFTCKCCGVLQVSLHLLDTASPFAVVLHDEITQHPEHVASDRDDLSITPRELHFTIAAAGQRLHSSEATLETRKASKVRRKSLRKSKTLAKETLETH